MQDSLKKFMLLLELLKSEDLLVQSAGNLKNLKKNSGKNSEFLKPPLENVAFTASGG